MTWCMAADMHVDHAMATHGHATYLSLLSLLGLWHCAVEDGGYAGHRVSAVGWDE